MTRSLPVIVDGHEVLIEMESVYGSEETSGGHDAIERAAGGFERAKATVIAVSTSMVEAIRAVDAALTPDEFTLEFGIKFKVDGSVVIASVSSEAALTVRMVYKHRRS